MASNNLREQCCPEYDVQKWDNKTHVWDNKLFIKDYVNQIFHIPLNMGAVIKRMFKKAEDAGAIVSDSEFLILSYDPSPWKSELYMSVSKDVPGAEMAPISGKFFTKVFDGPYDRVPVWMKETDEELNIKGLKAKKYYFHFAYCPKCAKKYGHNYCTAFAEL